MMSVPIFSTLKEFSLANLTALHPSLPIFPRCQSSPILSLWAQSSWLLILEEQLSDGRFLFCLCILSNSSLTLKSKRNIFFSHYKVCVKLPLTASTDTKKIQNVPKPCVKGLGWIAKPWTWSRGNKDHNLSFKVLKQDSWRSWVK